MAKQHSNCGNCVFYRDQQIMGVCRFFPQQVNKHHADWCGQHSEKREMVELPVREMNTERTVEGALDRWKQVSESFDKPKRKYTRKAKVEV